MVLLRFYAFHKHHHHYHRHYYLHVLFADIAKLLIQLTEETRTFHLFREAETAFRSLKEWFAAPVLRHPWSDEKFIVSMDLHHHPNRRI
jgi:hypothetical protein